MPRVIVTLHPALLNDAERLRSAAREIESAGELQQIDESMLAFGILFGELAATQMSLLKMRPDVLAVEPDEEQHTL